MGGKRALLILNKAKQKKYINKRKPKRIKFMQKYREKKAFNKSKTQQILCFDKIKTQSGHLSAMDYLGRSFPNQRNVKNL